MWYWVCFLQVCVFPPSALLHPFPATDWVCAFPPTALIYHFPPSPDFPPSAMTHRFPPPMKPTAPAIHSTATSSKPRDSSNSPTKRPPPVSSSRQESSRIASPTSPPFPRGFLAFPVRRCRKPRLPPFPAETPRQPPGWLKRPSTPDRVDRDSVRGHVTAPYSAAASSAPAATCGEAAFRFPPSRSSNH